MVENESSFQIFASVVNNLIVKFVEDDIVLSVNVKSVEYHSVNSIWQKSFIDLTPEDLVGSCVGVGRDPRCQ